MFNAEKPSLEELPSSAQLLKSTIIAAVSAVVILVTVVLPAEYGIDPTGVGRTIGLAEMGEIKTQLAEEAEADRLLDAAADEQSSLLSDFLGLFVSAAHAQEAEAWRDAVTFTLAPGDSAEWKLVMTEGQTAEYRMLVEGGRVNFDLHGHGSGQSVTYERGRGSSGDEGEIIADFDGEHGWFWRNRDSSPVTVTVQVRGEYAEFRDAS
ncbi:MAG: transmembrane anchor protein [Confluentimicrobium sp.]|uniref:transmembrane anchor protein n=1 Tax=Actibacterium sp. TaxID=1872125 RepID=UPI000C64608E|nr:transmembrane anchor protein [Actibacterium sp.]MBC55664.1 transmembrane anchor protein [Actibacterium sp.]|tara:strand:- start:439 stop:1062 length:624 start_codon:yes stop_codon:yes gene_type:complete